MAFSLAAVYGALSFLFSLLTLGQVGEPPSLSGETAPGVAVDLVGHFIFGFLVFLPARRWSWAVASGLLGVALDMDHLAAIIGLHAHSRPSHSVGFAVFIALALGIIACVEPLRRQLSPAMAALMGFVSVSSHIALDALVRVGKVPLLAPLSLQLYDISHAEGMALQAGGMVLVGLAAWGWDARLGSGQRGRALPS